MQFLVLRNYLGILNIFKASFLVIFFFFFLGEISKKGLYTMFVLKKEKKKKSLFYFFDYLITKVEASSLLPSSLKTPL